VFSELWGRVEEKRKDVQRKGVQEQATATGETLQNTAMYILRSYHSIGCVVQFFLLFSHSLKTRFVDFVPDTLSRAASIPQDAQKKIGKSQKLLIR